MFQNKFVRFSQTAFVGMMCVENESVSKRRLLLFMQFHTAGPRLFKIFQAFITQEKKWPDKFMYCTTTKMSRLFSAKESNRRAIPRSDTGIIKNQQN